ncbi:MAG: hypothetical protein AAF797_13300 [Planctomycetota bacterium]
METDSAEHAGERRPGRGWYGAAVLMVLATAGLFGYAVWSKQQVMLERVEGFTRFVVPVDGAVGEVEVAEPGMYTVFYENIGAFEGRRFETPRRLVWPFQDEIALRVKVAGPSEDGVEQLALSSVRQADGRTLQGDVDSDADSELTGRARPAVIYQTRGVGSGDDAMAGRAGLGFYQFEAVTAGVYRIEVGWKGQDEFAVPIFRTVEERDAAKAAAGDEVFAGRVMGEYVPQPVLLAVGKDPVSEDVLFDIFGLKGAASLLAFAFTGAAVMVVVTWVRRHPMQHHKSAWRAGGEEGGVEGGVGEAVVRRWTK